MQMRNHVALMKIALVMMFTLSIALGGIAQQQHKRSVQLETEVGTARADLELAEYKGAIETVRYELLISKLGLVYECDDSADEGTCSWVATKQFCMAPKGTTN